MNAKPLKIFFADDDHEDVELLEEGLQAVLPDHVFYYERDGGSVFEAIKSTMPDIIFLDYNMPKCNGCDCLKMIREDFTISQIPVVMYSTSSYRNHVEECFRLGAARFLLKPVDYPGVFKGLAVIIKLFRNDQLVTPSFDQFVIDTYQMS